LRCLRASPSNDENRTGDKLSPGAVDFLQRLERVSPQENTPIKMNVTATMLRRSGDVILGKAMTPYEDRDEEALHQSVVNALAQEIQQPVENVKIVYEVEFARLKSSAKVKDYLALLASRRAREKLLGKHSG